MKLLLQADGIQLSYGLRTVLDIKNLHIYEGDRIGLVGENGAGKTTLLSILSGDLTPDSGTIRRNCRIASIRQLGDTEESISEEQAAMFSVREKRDGLSGGERTRRRIAAAMSEDAPLLFADEPTTDLDEEGVELLKYALEQYDGTLVLISHDAELLDSLCTRIWHLEDGHLTDFPGTYTEYRRELERKRDNERDEYEKYRSEQSRLRASMQGISERTGQMKKAPSRMGNSEARLHKMDARQTSEQLHKAKRQLESRLSHMEVKERPREDISIKMALGAGTPVRAKHALTVELPVLKAGDTVLAGNVSFFLPTGSKTVLLGPNGCGKTTLLRAIAGGRDGVRLNPAVVPGRFDQGHESTLNFSDSALQNVLRESEHDESDCRTVLARLGLRGDDVFKPVSVLSGGERGRVAMAKLLLSKANLLMLDEPTNHMDIFTLEALAGLLEEYKGTLLFVSHDAAFTERVAERKLIFENGSITTLEKGAKKSYERDDAETEKTLIRLRMAELAARMSAPKKGDDPEKLNAEYAELIEKMNGFK